MLLIVGSGTVLVCVVGGYIAMGGKIEVLIQPMELVIIGGGALGAFIIANTKVVIKAAFKACLGLLKSSRHDKDSFLELLTLLYAIFKLSQTKGMLALEQHVENPKESALFNQFPGCRTQYYTVLFDRTHWMLQIESESRVEHVGRDRAQDTPVIGLGDN